MNKTKIEWTSFTWNPIRARRRDMAVDFSGKAITGTFCTRISPGCQHCYASVINKRFGTGLEYTVPNLAKHEFFIDEKILAEPLNRKKPARIFVGDMFDLFHEAIPFRLIKQVWDVAAECDWHTFQVLTKRAQRMREFSQWIAGDDHISIAEWPRNVWLGVSAEDQKRADERIPLLLQTPAAMRFLSVEPQLEAIDLTPYLEDPVYEMSRKREVCLPSGVKRRSGDSAGWDDLESSKERMGSVEKDRGEPSVQASESGAQLRRLFSDPNHDRRGEGVRTGASASLHPFEGLNPEGINDQSRERQEKGQSTGQFNPGDVLRAADSCSTRSEGGPRLQSGRHEQFNGEVDDPHRAGDPRAQKSGEEVGEHSQGLRSAVSGDFQDSQRRAPISLVICGGESGPGARPFNLAWAESILEQCKAAGVPFFMKQIGGRPYASKDSPSFGYSTLVFREHFMKDRKGGDPSEWPEHLRVREFPQIGS